MEFQKLEINLQEYEKSDKEETTPSKLTETIVDFQDPSSYFDQEAYRKQLRQEDNTFHLHVIAIFLGFLMMFTIIIMIKIFLKQVKKTPPPTLFLGLYVMLIMIITTIIFQKIFIFFRI